MSSSGSRITPAQAQRILRALPDVEERPYRGAGLSYRAENRVFATLWKADRRVFLKLPLELQAELVGADPDAFLLNGWSKHGWTGVALERAGADRLRELAQVARAGAGVGL